MSRIKSLQGLTLKEMTGIERETVRFLAEYFLSGKEGSITYLSEHLGYSKEGIGTAVRNMKQAGVIRVKYWLEPLGNRTVPTAVFEAGGEPDEPKPKPKTYNKKGESARQRARQEALERELQRKRLVSRELGEVIKPRLNPEEAHETNRRYWNWISGGAYG